MSMNQLARVVASMAAAAALGAVPAIGSAQASHGAGHGANAASSTPTGSGSADMMSMMKQGHEKMMSMPMTGKPDIDFAMMMRMHHMQAIEMAQLELRDGKAAKMREMASKIIFAQKKEIAQLDAFLARNGHNMAK